MDLIYAEMIGEIAPMVNSIILALIFGLASWLGIKVDSYMQSLKDNEKMIKIQQALETNKELVQLSVDYVEQIGENLLSEEKKALAIKKSTELANEWGVEISEVELETMIEQLVLGFKDGYKKETVQVEITDTDLSEIEEEMTQQSETNHEVVAQLESELEELKELSEGGEINEYRN